MRSAMVRDPSPYTIVIDTEAPFGGQVDAEALRGAVERTLAAEGVEFGSVTVLITDDATVKDLNARFLGIDEPTDVLSFSLAETAGGEDFVVPEGVAREIGEIVISLPTAERQAVENGLSLMAEMAHLAVHGTLHLLGYDHIEPHDEQQMRAKEEALLNEMGITVRHGAGGH